MRSRDNKPVKFAEMTEEEKVEWAKTYEWKSITVRKPNHLATTKKRNAAQVIKNRIKVKEHYDSPEGRKQWGDDYNARIRYLYQHNEEYRELKKYRVMYRDFQLRYAKKDTWMRKYYNYYKDRMHEKAETFRIKDTQLFLNGFTLKELSKYSPASYKLMQMFLKEGLFPEPKYEGHKFVKNGFEQNTEKFYLVSEVEIFLNVFCKYRRKFLLVKNKDQKAYLKKQLWTKMNNAREQFDNE